MTRSVAALIFAFTAVDTSSAGLIGVIESGFIISIDPNSGAGTLVASTGLDFVTGLELGPDGNYYASTNTTLRSFFRLDPVTFAPTFVGNVGSSVFVQDLSFATSGTLFASGSTNRLAS